MTSADTDSEKSPERSSKLLLVLGVVFALLGAGGGFYATWSGVLFGSQVDGTMSESENLAAESSVGHDIAYVAMDPLIISLGSNSSSRHLKFRAQLEVSASAEAEVSKVLPRVVDVLNSYLRAVEPADLENPASLVRLRGQMLRRIQVVTAPGQVKDLLIMEFVVT